MNDNEIILIILPNSKYLINTNMNLIDNFFYSTYVMKFLYLKKKKKKEF
jgi:hypothetical protein